MAGGFGAYSKKPEDIGRTVAEWLKDPEILLNMKHAALKAARPRASYDIAREIADMVFPDVDSAELGEDYVMVGGVDDREVGIEGKAIGLSSAPMVGARLVEHALGINDASLAETRRLAVATVPELEGASAATGLAPWDGSESGMDTRA